MYKRYKEQFQQNEKMAKTVASKLKIVMFLGSVREGRMATRVAEFIKHELKKDTEVELEVMDPMVIKLPLLEQPLHYIRDRSTSKLPYLGTLVDCEAKLKAADAFIIVSAEYNHSIPPALSSFMSHFGSSLYSYKPSGIVCYSLGIYGGVRAAMQLRCFLSELGTLSVSNIFGIPSVDKALSEDGTPSNEHMVKGLNRLMTQLMWHANSMKNHRQTFGIPQ